MSFLCGHGNCVRSVSRNSRAIRRDVGAFTGGGGFHGVRFGVSSPAGDTSGKGGCHADGQEQGQGFFENVDVFHCVPPWFGFDYLAGKQKREPEWLKTKLPALLMDGSIIL